MASRAKIIISKMATVCLHALKKHRFHCTITKEDKTRNAEYGKIKLNKIESLKKI